MAVGGPPAKNPVPSRIRLSGVHDVIGVSATDLRLRNLETVVAVLAEQGTSSRADIATRTGLTRSTVSILAQELIDGGIVSELGIFREGNVGRPRSSLVLNREKFFGVGVELNVGHWAVCVMDIVGTVTYQKVHTAPTSKEDPERVFDMLGSAVTAAMRSLGPTGGSMAGVVVALPGIVDSEKGLVSFAPSLGWRDQQVAQALSTRLGGQTPVALVNSADSAALGEAWFGLRDAYHSFMRITDDDQGIGGGLVVDYELFQGARGVACEVGHLVVVPNGQRCHCGARGCLETVASSRAILHAAGLAPDDYSGSDQSELMELLVARLEQGDPQALEAVAKAGSAIAAAFSLIAHLLDPGAVIIGGGLAAITPWLLSKTSRVAVSEAQVKGVRIIDVAASRLGVEAAVLGAAGMAARAVLASPGSFLNVRGS